MVSLEECRDSIDFFISSVQRICVMCRNFDGTIGSSTLDLLPDLLQLEVHSFRLKGDIIHDIGSVLTVTMEDSVEHCFWVYVHG